MSAAQGETLLVNFWYAGDPLQALAGVPRDWEWVVDNLHVAYL